MENNELIKMCTEKAQLWLGEGYDEETAKEIQEETNISTEKGLFDE